MTVLLWGVYKPIFVFRSANVLHGVIIGGNAELSVWVLICWENMPGICRSKQIVPRDYK